MGFNSAFKALIFPEQRGAVM